MESKYYKWNKRGSRIIIDTGYKTFDNYIDCISHGNRLGGGQTSFYIRPYNKTECNGNIRKPDELRTYDLSMFDDLDRNVLNYVKRITTDNSCILYEFYTYKKDVKNKIGYIVEQNGTFKIFNNNTHNYWYKKQQCLETIVKVLEEKC